MLRSLMLVGVCSLSFPLLASAHPAPRAQELPQKAHGHFGIEFWADERDGQIWVVSTPRWNSPACQAGLRRHDVLLEIDGRPLDDPNEVLNRFASCRPGTIVAITVLRGEELQTIYATVGLRTPQMTNQEVDQRVTELERQTGVVEGVGEEFLQ